MDDVADGGINATGVALNISWRDRIAVVAATGVLDMFTAPRLSEAVDTVLAEAPEGLIIDLGGVRFLASAGMNALIAANDKAAPAKFSVVADGPATSRPMKLIGIDQSIDLQPTFDAALRSVTEG